MNNHPEWLNDDNIMQALKKIADKNLENWEKEEHETIDIDNLPPLPPLLAAKKQEILNLHANSAEPSAQTLIGTLHNGALRLTSNLLKVLRDAFVPDLDLSQLRLATDGVRLDGRDEKPTLWDAPETETLRKQTNWLLIDVVNTPKGAKLKFTLLKKDDTNPPAVQILIDGEEVDIIEESQHGDYYHMTFDRKVDLENAVDVHLEDNKWVVELVGLEED